LLLSMMYSNSLFFKFFMQLICINKSLSLSQTSLLL